MDSPLGKPTLYPERYDPSLLAPLARATDRRAMGLAAPLPFTGEDLWHGYEFSWLCERGLPQVRILRLRFDAASPFMLESKSLKLYLNGLAQARFPSAGAVSEVLAADLGRACGAAVAVELLDPAQVPCDPGLPGRCLDGLEVRIDAYERNADLLGLRGSAGTISEILHTHLFRSLCPVTGQPDWASVLVEYQGRPIDHGSLLRYLVSYRRHQAFHEATIEQIYLDLIQLCECERLLVAGYFLRRGGLDINPVRASHAQAWPVRRLARQ